MGGGGFENGEGDSGVGFWGGDFVEGVRREGVGAWEAEPGAVDTAEASESVDVAAEAELEEVVEVAEAPGDEAEAGDAEEGVEDLRVDFDPDAAGGVDVVALFFAVGAGWVAHELFAAAD